MNPIGYGTILIQNPADAIQFRRLGAVVFYSFRAFCGGPFLHFDSNIDCFGAFVILSEEKKVHCKMRFFCCNPTRYHRGWTLIAVGAHRPQEAHEY
jgi:hypothetical protein